MKIRLHGTKDELEITANLIRPPSTLVRRYLEIRI